VRYGVVLFACDRGIPPARAARVAEDAGFDSFAVPEHTHIPVRRQAAHPGTGDSTLPDDRYMRVLDPWWRWQRPRRLRPESGWAPR
jgi:hypothetical protein